MILNEFLACLCNLLFVLIMILKLMSFHKLHLVNLKIKTGIYFKFVI